MTKPDLSRVTAAGRGYDLRARRITATYVTVGLLWIFTSDYAAQAFTRLRYLPMLKGTLFVLTTGALLHVLLSRYAAYMRRSQAELVASEERFRKVVEHAPAGIFIHVDGTFRYLNHVAVEVFGANSAAELVGQPVMDRIDPRFREVVQRRIDLLKAASVPPMEQKWLRLDGSQMDVEVSSVPFELDGEAGALVFFVNISDRLRGEEERRQLEEQVRQAQRMDSIGRLAGGVAHDFNNLLTIINGYSEILIRRTPPEDPNYDPILEIHNAGDRAVGITRQLLAFSRKEQASPKIIDPNQVIRDTERMIRRLLGENIRATVQLHTGRSLVLADAGSLTQVLLNLAANARDAMPGGGEFLLETGEEEIGEEWCKRIAAARPGRMVRITARDTGCGMDEQTQARMFEPFFTTKASGQGTGLGLSIVYGIVKSSGGWLEVQSRPGEGTAISVFLPACADAGAVGAAGLGSTAPVGREMIMLVEDEPGVRNLASTLLSSAGYRVLSCASADEALDWAQSSTERVDLLLTDVVMPGKQGTELAKLLAEKIPGIRVILMSGYSRENLTPSATSNHHAFLPKPFSTSALLSVVRKVLDEPQPARSAS